MAMVIPAERTETELPERSSRPLLGDKKKIHRGPQAFINDFRTEYVIKPHFHRVDQFQIFTRGNVKIGKASHSGVVVVHYTDAFTPYGPITCDEEGMTFFNLRPRSDVDAYWMPGSRDDMPRNAGRHRDAECVVESLDDPSTIVAGETVLVPTEPDGLSVFSTVAAPGDRLPEPIAGGSGRYELVLAGSLEVEGETLLVDSVIFTAAGDKLPERTAGPNGVQILTAQPPSD
jgi:hypothetical protein